MDYSVNSVGYDVNGNIANLNRNGFALGSGANIDNLTYNYLNGSASNKLMNVIDNANNAQSTLGDFKYAHSKLSSSVDYGYDGNGNLVSDNNKKIGSITYNAINLPATITVNGKGSVSYVYDADGRKLKKVVQENNATVPFNGVNYTTNITTTTLYMGKFIYQSLSYSNPSLASLQYPETLQMIAHEEGRARLSNNAYAFDYFVRDHIGNIRVTLSDEQQQDTYPAATLESGGVATEQSYYNIVNDANHVIPTSSLAWYGSAAGSSYQNNNGIPTPPDPTINRTAASTKLYKLNGATGDRFGMGIALKVMSGDVINIFGKSVWHNNGQATNNSSYLISGVLSTFINSFAGTATVVNGSKGTATGGNLNGNTATTSNLSNWLNGVPTPAGATPRAYINWILFDEQFRPVQSGSGFDMVSASADVVKSHARTGLSVPKNGYIYIYCSNESNQDVYFDNLQVVHNRSALIEERHYYPDGLLMAGISSRAFGKLQNNFGYQGKELQAGEFYNGQGLDLYDFDARYYDPQLGRWWGQDPAGQFASPYLAMGNNWPATIDPDGKFAWFVPIIVGAAIGATTSAAVYAISAGSNFTWSGLGKAAAFGAVGGAISGGMSAIGTSLGTFGQSLAYNIMSSTAGTIGTNLAFGNEGTWGTVAGAVVSGVIGGDMGNFTGVNGGAFKNAVAEIGFNAVKGGVTGMYSGAVSALVDGTDMGEGILNGAKFGAIGGGVSSGLMIATFGSAIKPDQNMQKKIWKINKEYGISNSYAPVFRRGGLYEFFYEAFTGEPARGVTWGRNLVVPDDDAGTYVHEYMHFVQQVQMGWGTMQGKGIYEQVRMFLTGGSWDPYGTLGTIENGATKMTKKYWP
jgi:RHS repeat-associated protein